MALVLAHSLVQELRLDGFMQCSWVPLTSPSGQGAWSTVGCGCGRGGPRGLVMCEASTLTETGAGKEMEEATREGFLKEAVPECRLQEQKVFQVAKDVQGKNFLVQRNHKKINALKSLGEAF